MDDLKPLVPTTMVLKPNGKTSTKVTGCIWSIFLLIIMTLGVIGLIFGITLMFQIEKHTGTLSFQTVIVQNHLSNASKLNSLKAVECSYVNPALRFDCHPDAFASSDKCTARGCCWDAHQAPSTRSRKFGNYINAPACYFPTNYPKYTTNNIEKTNFGYSAKLHKSVKSHWPMDILQLQMDVYFISDSTLRFKIYDPRHARYEVPLPTVHPKTAARNPDYKFLANPDPFTFKIMRKDGKTELFSTDMKGAPLIYADQFIQISTAVSSGMLYGLGEHRGPMYHDLSKWQQFSYWARDQPPSEGANLYASHPFFMSFDANNQAYGVFLLNSNAMDTDLQPTPSVTFRTIGGILDFFVFTGPTPDLVVQQYTEIVGRPSLPPYWALGFHLCRWGYNSTSNLRAVVKRMRDARFPYWNDIDYMRNHLDWTYDHNRFKDFPDVVKDLHDNGQHYVVIVDPGISSTQAKGSYMPYDEGVQEGVFIKNHNEEIAIGKVWPGKVAFPDFTNPKAVAYWYKYISSFHKEIPFDGLWTDMNEPSNFVFGSTVGCTNSTLDLPPYTPGIWGYALADKTLCPSAVQHLSTHYNVHNLYGLYEMKATNVALKKLRKKRSFIISRSTFPSAGVYGGHWSGDNSATWYDLQQSVPEILTFQMFGIPLVGADICGFNGNSEEELCVRWMQLGAFYPFMRNHNTLTAMDQDPAAWSESAQQAIKKALELRYSLLPYLYTLLYTSHVNGSAVAWPLSFKYYNDKRVHRIDTQLMWGDSLLISPVLKQGARSVQAFIPKDAWFNFFNGSYVANSGSWTHLSAPLDFINIHQRGGTIVPMQRSAVTTTAARKLPFSLQVALDGTNLASGILYWDDGDSIDSVQSEKYTLIRFGASPDAVWSEIVKAGYVPELGMTLEAFRILGLNYQPSVVRINDQPVEFDYNEDIRVGTDGPRLICRLIDETVAKVAVNAGCSVLFIHMYPI